MKTRMPLPPIPFGSHRARTLCAKSALFRHIYGFYSFVPVWWQRYKFWREERDVARCYYVMVLRDLLPLPIGCQYWNTRATEPGRVDNAVCWLVQARTEGNIAMGLLYHITDQFVTRSNMFAHEEAWNAPVRHDLPYSFHDYRQEEDSEMSEEVDETAKQIANISYFEGNTLATVVITGGDFDLSDYKNHWEQSFRLFVEMIDALRSCGAVPLPDISDIESIHPFYARVVEFSDGTREMRNVITDLAGVPYKWHNPISRDVTNAAAQHFLHRRQDSPISFIIEWMQRSRSAKLAGDHGKCVVYAAIAAEQALSHFACVLQWEDNQRVGSDERRDLSKLFVAPHFEHRKVIGEKLGFEYDTQKADCPDEIRAWRRDIAGIRNTIMHSGHYPSALEADAAVETLWAFVAYLVDRVEKHMTQYPKSALILCETYSLDYVYGGPAIGISGHPESDLIHSYRLELGDEH